MTNQQILEETTNSPFINLWCTHRKKTKLLPQIKICTHVLPPLVSPWRLSWLWLICAVRGKFLCLVLTGRLPTAHLEALVPPPHRCMLGLKNLLHPREKSPKCRVPPPRVFSATILLHNQLFLRFALCLGLSQAALLILNCNSNEAVQAYRVSASVYSTVVLAKVLLTRRRNLYQSSPRSKQEDFKQLQTRKPSPNSSQTSQVFLTFLWHHLASVCRPT